MTSHIVIVIVLLLVIALITAIRFRGRDSEIDAVNYIGLIFARQCLGLRQSSGALEFARHCLKAPEVWRSPRPGGICVT